MPSTAERLAIADVMARHADGLRRLARRDERYVPVSAELKEAIRVAKLTPSETYTTDGTDGEYVTTYVKAPKPTRRQLQAQIDDLRAEIKRLELVLSQHACDCTRHATPRVEVPSCWPVDPDDGWPPNVTVGPVTVTTTEWELQPKRMWCESTWVRGWVGEELEATR